MNKGLMTPNWRPVNRPWKRKWWLNIDLDGHAIRKSLWGNLYHATCKLEFLWSFGTCGSELSNPPPAVNHNAHAMHRFFKHLMNKTLCHESNSKETSALKKTKANLQGCMMCYRCAYEPACLKLSIPISSHWYLCQLLLEVINWPLLQG